MAKKDYIVTRSNYTVKKKHKVLSDKTIYEQDYMTLTNNGGWDDGYIPYGEGNFKMVVRDLHKGYRKHKVGDWSKPSNCIEGDESCEFWTNENLTQPDGYSPNNENEIKLKPNSESIVNFAYFGSATRLLETSITDIISKFPAELYVSDNQYRYIKDTTEVILGSNIMTNPVIVENPFEIDITTTTLDKTIANDPNVNQLRYFALGYLKYNLLDKNNEFIDCLRTWSVDTKLNKDCFKNGDRIATITINEVYLIYQYYVDGKFILLTEGEYSGMKFRPLQKYIQEFFENLDDFQSTLLNRDSNPIYTATFDQYVVDDRSRGGYGVLKQTFTWPVTHQWNLNITSNAFKSYIDSLLNLVGFYDSMFTNNLWNNMTHDSIKNMDETFHDNRNNLDAEDYQLGIGHLEGLFWAFGRQFDELKKYIDNIHHTNTITYNGQGNLPDYFLSDTLSLSGWEVSSAVNGLDPQATVKNLYPGSIKEYNVNDVNKTFMQVLKLNSGAIMKRKGTRNAIEMLFGLFGFTSYDYAKNLYESKPRTMWEQRNAQPIPWNNLEKNQQLNFYDYKINEYVTVAKNTAEDVIPADNTFPEEMYNAMKTDFFANYSADNGDDPLMGLPVRVVYIEKENDGEIEELKYLIPWFAKRKNNSIADKSVEYDGDMYFQMYGGWGKTFKKDISLPAIAPNVHEIFESDDMRIYDETKKYLHVVENIEDLMDVKYDNLVDGDIYYVNDITNIGEYYPNIENASNYFILEDHKNYYVYGTNDEGITGWENIPLADIENANNKGLNVLYLESLIDDMVGNNPHVGYWKYDDGETFIDYFRQLFKYSIENDGFEDEAYECESGKLLDGIINCGFQIDGKEVDNMKVWYFNDAVNGKIYRLKKIYEDGVDDYGNIFNVPSKYEEVENADNNNIGHDSYTNQEAQFETNLSPFNLETQESNNTQEGAANSVINLKNITITFNEKYGKQSEFKNYLFNTMMPYIKQLIPSTTIFEIKIDGEGADYTCQKFATISNGIKDKSSVTHE